MILSFKPQFKEPILTGTKIHTIRTDVPGRWKEGNQIHFATGVRTKNYECFKEGTCLYTQEVEIGVSAEYVNDYTVVIDGRSLGFSEIQQFAKNDGFENLMAFWLWFEDGFKGKLIHWTDLRY